MRGAFLAWDHFAMWQVALLQKFLRNAGWRMDTLTLGGMDVQTDGGIFVRADLALEEAHPQNYGLLLLPGIGGQIKTSLLENPVLLRFVQSFPGPIAASCSSALLLAKAKRIEGKYTTTAAVKQQFDYYFTDGVYTNEEVCEDRGIVTSKGSAHIQFMMKVLDLLGLLNKDPKLEKIALKLANNTVFHEN